MGTETRAALPPEPCIVTISRQLGSGGGTVARELAQHLGIPCYDREILERAAQKLDLPEDLLECREEMVRSVWEAVAESFSPATPDGLYYPPPLSLPTEGEVREVESAIISQIAATESAVIVGRGGVHVLGGHPRTLSVFLHASDDFRRERVQERFGVSAREARTMLERSDRDRTRYHELFGEHEWTDARQYSACLDVSALGLPGTVAVLCAHWRARFGTGG